MPVGNVVKKQPETAPTSARLYRGKFKVGVMARSRDWLKPEAIAWRFWGYKVLARAAGREFNRFLKEENHMTHKCILVVPGAEKIEQAYIVDRVMAQQWGEKHLLALGEKGANLKAKIYEVQEVLVEEVSIVEGKAKVECVVPGKVGA